MLKARLVSTTKAPAPSAREGKTASEAVAEPAQKDPKRIGLAGFFLFAAVSAGGGAGAAALLRAW